MRSGRLFWAVVLIVLGFFFLASNLGLLSINVWNLFWPVFLVLLGVWFLVGSTLKSSGGMEMEVGSVDLGEAQSASVTIKHGAGRLSLSGAAGAGKLVTGSFANGLDARVQDSGGRLQVILQPQSRAFPDVFFPGSWASGKGLAWDFSLSKEIPLDLVFEIGAVDAHLDLTELKVKDLVIKTGASSTAVKLPAAAGATRFKVEAGAASVDITVPQGVAARIEAEAGLASVKVDESRFPKVNGIFQSPDYEAAENKVDIRIETGMASIEIH
jgi:hypothetical protein